MAVELVFENDELKQIFAYALQGARRYEEIKYFLRLAKRCGG